MTPRFSIYLDGVRFVAALIVLLSHLAYDRYTHGALGEVRAADIGRDAVVLFFVLSGLVIAYASERDGSASRFAYNRLTRLASVLVPALVLTFLFDRLGQGINPAAYAGWWYQPTTLEVMLGRGLTLSNEWSAGRLRLGSNGPLWSLSYEAAFYLLYGIAIFTRGFWRGGLILTATLLIGPRVLLLLPVWLFGVAAWRRIRDPGNLPTHRLAMVLVFAFPGFYAVGHAVDLPEVLNALSRGILAAIDPEFVPAFSDSFLWHSLLGLAFAAHLVGLAGWFQHDLSPMTAPLAKTIRWLAGASFTLYALHYPALQFAHAAIPEGTPARGWVLTVLVLCSCFLVAQFTERQLKPFRNLLVRRTLRAV